MTARGLSMLGGQTKLQVVPNDIKKTWNEHALQGLIIVSLTLQIILTLLGKLRKYNPRTLIKITLWCVYFLAYAVIPAALSITAQSALETCDNSKYQKLKTSEFMSFWAQFLFLHLGGPDTITAYSSEDNNLWLRHLVSLVIQSGVALYILLLSLPGCSHLPLLSIFIYAVGCIKCFERVQAQRLANTKHLRETMLGPADPGPDYVKFLEEYQLKRSQGFLVKVEEVPESPLPIIHAYAQSGHNEIIEAYNLLQTFKRIFAGLILTYEDRDRSTSYFRHLDSSEAFHVVEIELGFVHDMLYTKASVVYTKKGLILRGISVLLIFLVLFGFHFHSDMGQYLVIDIAITYLVIGTEVLKEVFAFITMLRSDWTDLWLKQHNLTRNNLIFPFLKQPSKKGWSHSMAQLDLLSVALKEKPACFLSHKFFGVETHLKKQRYETYTEVSANLKKMIYSQFFKLVECSPDPKGLCNYKGSYSIQENDMSDLLWSTNEVEFGQSILIWHIATTLCYHSEINDQLENNCIESKNMSEYLVSLLILNPEMLPNGIGMIRFRDTCAEAIRFFKMKGPITKKSEACIKLLEVSCEELLPSIVKGDQSKSVLFDGCRVALALRKMKSREKMWKLTSEVWIEFLAYAAAHCRVTQHSQQLGRGGEFLTHVWLLMAHLGMTEHFQVTHGHARARFNVT